MVGQVFFSMSGRRRRKGFYIYTHTFLFIYIYKVWAIIYTALQPLVFTPTRWSPIQIIMPMTRWELVLAISKIVQWYQLPRILQGACFLICFVVQVLATTKVIVVSTCLCVLCQYRRRRWWLCLLYFYHVSHVLFLIEATPSHIYRHHKCHMTILQCLRTWHIDCKGIYNNMAMRKL